MGMRDQAAENAASRVRRFLDARDGYFPLDLLAVVTRTGDRLLASDLRALLDALARVEALADCPPGDCEGHPCIWPEDITEALSELEGVGTGAGEGAPRQDTGSAWVTRSEDCPEAPAQAHPLALDPAGQVADEAYAAGCRDGCAEAEARLAAVRALLSLWESWDGTRPHPGESSPRQREQLRLALGTREDRLRGALGLTALDAIPAEVPLFDMEGGTA